jgi:alanine transaminase
VDLLVSPPKPGQPSYALFEKETSLTLNNLRDRSLYMADKFNSLPGMSCQPADGAMYLFPKIDIPQKAIDEAKKRGKEADVMYALDLLGEFVGLLSRCAALRGQENKVQSTGS